MAKNIQYNIGIKTDISDASNSIKILQEQLQKIATLPLQVQVNDADLKKASEAAKALQVHLTSAFNTSTGQLDLTKFNNSVISSGQSIKQLGTDLLNCGAQGTQAFTQLITSIGQAQAPLQRTNKMVQDLGTTLKNTIKWQLSSNVIHGLQSALSEAVSYSKALNTSLNDIRIVTGKTADDMERFTVAATKAASSLNTTTKKYADASLIYYQQGDTDEEVAKKAAITTKAANVSFSASAKEMSEMLTAVWNSYQVGEEELQKYVDIMAALGAATATSTEEIATAMQKVAATANTVGVSMEQMSSIIATVSSVTREAPQSIGTSFKTILARIGDLKLGGTDEDGIGLGLVSSQLKSIGINILDTTGNLRDMGDVIEEMGSKWKTMGKVQQTALAQAVAGKRQYTQLIALMENMDKYETNKQTAEDSGGTLDAQAAIYAESWQAASDKVTASLESIYNKLLDDRVFVSLINGLAEITKQADNFIEGMGGLKGVLTSIAALATNLFDKQIGSFLDQMPQKIEAMSAAGRQNQFNRSQEEINQGLSSVLSNSNITGSQREQIDMTQQLMNMQRQLGESSQNMSQQQIAAAQAIIASYKMEEEAIIQSMQAAEESGQKLQATLSEVQATQAKTAAQANTSIKDPEAYFLALKENTWNQQAVNSLTSHADLHDITNIQQAVDKYQELAIAQQNALKAQQEFPILTQAWGESLKDTEQPIAQIGESLKTYIQKAFSGNEIQKFESLVDAALKKPEAEARSGLLNVLQQIKDEFGMNADKAEFFKNQIVQMLTATGKFTPDQLNAVTQAMDDFAKKTVEATNNQERGVHVQQEFSTAIAQTQATIGTLASQTASVAMSITSLYNSIGNITTIWGDKSKSGLDKFIATLGALPMIINATSASFKLYNTIVGLKKPIADAAGAVGSKVGAAGMKAFGVATWTAMAPLLPFIIAIGALIAVFALLKSAENAHKAQLEAIAEAQEAENEAIQKTLEAQKEESKAYADTLTNFLSLLEQKQAGKDVDEQLAEMAENLAAKYDLTGAALARLTDNYDDYILKASQAAEQDAQQNLVDSQDLADRAYRNIGAAAFDSDYAQIQGLSPVEWARAAGYGGYQSMGVNEWQRYLSLGLNDLINGNGIKYSSGIELTSNYDRDNFNSNTLVNKDTNTSTSMSALARQFGLSGYLATGDNNMWALASANDTSEYRLSMYEATEDFLNGVAALNIEWDANSTEFLNGIIRLNAELESQTSLYREAQSQITTDAKGVLQAKMLRGYGAESYDDFNAVYADMYSWAEVNRESLGIDPDLMGEELRLRLDAIVSGIIAENSALDDYVIARQAIFEKFSIDQDSGVTKIAMAEYIAQQYGVAAISGASLTALENYELTGTDVADQVAQFMSQEGNSAAVNSGVTTAAQEKETQSQAAIAAAKKLLKSDMTSEEANSLYSSLSGSGIGWDAAEKAEEKAAEFAKFMSMTYAEQTQYFTDLENQNAQDLAKNAQQALVDAQAIYDQAAANYDKYDVKQHPEIEATINGYTTEIQTRDNNLAEAAKLSVNDAGELVYSGTDQAFKEAAETAFKAYTGDPQDFVQNYADGFVLSEEAAEYDQAYTEFLAAQAGFDAAQIDEITARWAAQRIEIEEINTNLATYAKLIKNGPSNAEEWLKLSTYLGKTAEELQKLSNLERSSLIAQQAETEFNQLMSDSDARAWYNENGETTGYDSYEDWKAAINTTDTGENGIGTIMSDSEYAEATNNYWATMAGDAALQWDSQNEAIEKNVTNLENISSTLNDLDLTSLPEQGTIAYNNLNEALLKTGITMTDFLNMDRIEQIRAVGTAKQTNNAELLSQNEIAQAEAERLRVTAHDRGDTTTEKLYADELSALEQEALELTEQSEQDAEETIKAVANQYKTQIMAASAAVEAQIDILNTKISEAQSLASQMGSALEFGDLSFEVLEQLRQFDDLNGTTFSNSWNQATSAIERAVVASNLYQEAITATAAQQESLTSSVGEFATVADGKITAFNQDLFNSLSNSDDFYTQLGESGLSDAAQKIISDAYSNISNQIYDGMSNDAIKELLLNEINVMMQESANASDEVVAEYKTTMQGLFKQMENNAVDQAQKVVDTWLTAFETIKKAKLQIAEGGSLAELLMGDAAGIQTVLETIMTATNPETGESYSLEDAQALFYSGGPNLQAALSYGSITQQERLLASGYGLIQTGADGEIAGSYALAKQAWVDENTSNYGDVGDSAAVDAASAAFDELFRETMSGLGLDDALITDLIGGNSWDVLNGKLETFSTATDMAATALSDFTKIEVAKAERDLAIEQNTRQAEKAENFASVAYSAIHREEGQSVVDILNGSGVSRRDFAEIAGMKTASTASEADIDTFLNNLDESALTDVYNEQTQAATEFYGAVVGAADAFLAKFTGDGEFAGMLGTEAAEEEATTTSETAHDTAETATDEDIYRRLAQEEIDRQNRTTNRVTSLNSLWSSGPQTASDFQTLIDAGVGSSVAEIQNMTQVAYRDAVKQAIQRTLDNTVSDSQYAAMTTEQQQEVTASGKDIVSDTEYAQMQATQVANNNAAAQSQYEVLNQSIQNTLTSLTDIGSVLSGLDLTSLPLKGSAAWDELNDQLTAAGISLDEFNGLTRGEQIKTLGDLQTTNLQEQIDQYDALINQADRYANDTSLSEAERMAWQQKSIDLQYEQAQLQTEQNNQELETLQQLSNYYDSEYSKVAERQSEQQEKMDKAKSEASIMGNAAITGELSMEDRAQLSDASAFEAIVGETDEAAMKRRVDATVAQYTEAMNEALTTRDMKLQESENGLAGLTQLNLSDLTTAAVPVSKNEFINMLGDLEPEIAGALSSAWDSALGTLSVDELNNLSWSDVAEKLETELTNAGIDATEVLDKEMGVIQDSIIEIYASVSEQELEIAQNAVNAWREAFDEIANLRQSIISGEGISDVMLSSLSDFTTAVNAYKGSIDEMIAAYKAGTLANEDFSLGTPEEYEANMRRSLGLDKLFQDGNLISGRDTDSLAAVFGIKRETFDEGDEGDKAYQEAVQKSTEPYLRALLSEAGLQDHEITSVLTQYWAGSEEAVTTIQNAGTKMGEVAERYAELYTENAAIQEEQKKAEKQESDLETSIADKSTQVEQHQTALNTASTMSQIGQDMMLRDSDVNAMDILGDQLPVQQVLDAVNQQFATQYADLNEVTSDQWEAFMLTQQDVAEQETAEIARLDSEIADLYTQLEAVWQALRDKLVAPTDQGGFGLGEDNEYVQSVDAMISDIQTNLASAQQVADAATAESNSFDTNAQAQMWTAYADSIGQTSTELQQYAQHLYEVAGNSGNLLQATEDQQREFAKLATQINNIANAWEELTENQDENISIIKSGNKAYPGYLKTVQSVSKNIKAIFGDSLDDIDKFVEDNIDLIEDMADGVEGAAEDVEEAFLRMQMSESGIDYDKEVTVTLDKDGLQNDITTVGELLNNFGDQFADKEIGFVATVDDEPAIAGLNDLLASGALTADQMNALLATIGWAPEITYQTADGKSSYSGEQIQTMVGNGEATQVKGTTHFEVGGQIYIPIIGSVKKTGGGASSGVKKPSPGRGGGGGGGGGGKPKKLDKKKPEDEIERYHEINKVLERLSDRLDTIDKLKNRAYGQGYLKNLQKEIDLTKKQCEAYQQYIDEAQAYLSTDAARVASIGATFDEYGNISNYTEVMQGLIDKYNAFIEKYNKATSAQQEKMDEEKEEWDEWYEDRVEWIEKYEESLATANEQENALLEAQNKISELALEGIEYKVTIKTDLSKAEIDFLEYLIDKYDEVIEKQGETMSMLVAETDAALSNLSTLAQEQRELTDAYNEGTLNQADYTEGLQNLNDKILEELQNLEDLKDSITELYGNTLNTATDELNRHTAKIDAASEAMSSYIQILGLLGNGTNYKQLTSFYDQQYQYSVQSLQTQQEYLTVLKQEEQYYLDRLAQNGELTDLEREQYEALEETINDTQNNILSATENTLSLITEAFNNEIESIFKDLEEKIAGVGNSLDGLADSYAYYQESQERYVNSAKELYEVSKLNRQIETSINDTTSIVNKNLLKQLQDKINKQSELNELTQYDIDMNNLQYQLLLKKIALEDAQNAKSVVQLTRDTEGNYMYRYTANQDEVAKSQQEYEDILQQINDLSVNRAADLESQLLSIYQTTTSKIKEIAMDQTLTEDEKYAKIQELMTRFTEQSTYIQQEYQKVTGNLMENQLAISDYYGTELQTSAGETSLGLNSTIADMIAHTADLQYQMQLTCADAIPAAMQEMADRIDAVSQTIGINFNNINASIGTYNKIVLDAQTESSKLATTLEEQVLPEIHDITDAWDKYNDQLQEVVDTYEKMYSAIVAILKAQASLGGASGAAASSPSGNSYATGGLVDYTGPAWVDGTKNKPELMLNATDTENLLQTVSSLNELDSNTIGVINQYILNAVSAMSSAYSGLTASQVPLTNNELSQNVHITAEFPNATNHQEIEDAFDNLVNRAAQYVTTIKD